MKTITSLRKQKRNPNRVNVYLDEHFALGLSTIIASQLKIGQLINEDELAELHSLDEVESAFQQALGFIDYRPRSIQEVQKKLVKKGHDTTIVNIVLSRLIEKNFLDDMDFALRWVESRNATKPRSKFALQHELRQKGISDQTIKLVLENIDDLEMARKAGKLKAHHLSHYEHKLFVKKLSSHLAYRGFGFGIIREVCDEIWNSIEN